MSDLADAAPCLFEIHHGSAVIRISDDWSGHILIEQIYDGLRQARQLRDAGHVGPASPAPGSEAANAMIETAMFHGFQRVGDTEAYHATADQIIALMMAAREQGRKETRQDAGSLVAQPPG